MKSFLKDLGVGFAILIPMFLIIFSALVIFSFLTRVLSQEIITYGLVFMILSFFAWMVGYVARSYK